MQTNWKYPSPISAGILLPGSFACCLRAACNIIPAGGSGPDPHHRSDKVNLMNILDMRTVFSSYVISSVISMAVMASLWLQNRRRSPELAFWLADFTMQSTGLLLSLLRGTLPDFFSMVISNALIIGGTLLLLIGLERYTGKTGPQWHNYIFLGIFILVQIYFIYVQPSLQVRNINVSLAIILLCAQCAWLLLRRVDPGLRSSTRPTGVIFIAFCLVALVRVFESLAAPVNNNFFKSGLYDTLAILTYQMLYIGLTYVLFLMVTRRLLTALESDIAERKLAEAALKISEEKFSIAFQNIPDALVITSIADGKIIEANGSFFGMSGFGKEECLGRTTIDLDLWGNLAQRNELVEALQKQQRVLNFETVFRRKSGELFSGSISGELIQLQGQTCVLTVIQDITERKQAEEMQLNYNTHLEAVVRDRTHELREAQEQLVRQEKLAVLGQMAGSVGHELRNPLGVIQNSIYYLKLVQSEAGEKIKQHHAIIEQQVQTADKIIGDLLDFSRLKSADRAPAAVPALVHSTLSRFPVPASVKVALKLPPDLPLVFADPLQMEQVLGNLTVNACQAMQAAGKLTISACVVFPVTARDQEKQMVAIAVKDNGVGIPPENMAKLFEPLFTTKAKGIGLGLVVSKKLAEANGGRIEVESQPGKGSTFTLVLPVQEDKR